MKTQISNTLKRIEKLLEADTYDTLNGPKICHSELLSEVKLATEELDKEKAYYVSYREYNEYTQFEGDWNLQLKECQTLEEAQKFVEDVKGGRYRNDFRDFKILVEA